MPNIKFACLQECMQVFNKLALAIGEVRSQSSSCHRGPYVYAIDTRMMSEHWLQHNPLAETSEATLILPLAFVSLQSVLNILKTSSMRVQA